MSRSGNGKLRCWELTAIGLGGMVGGGNFAVLGLSVDLTRGGAPVAFLIAGMVALVTSYSYARLSVTLPSQGGTLAFLDRAFGPGLMTTARRGPRGADKRHATVKTFAAVLQSPPDLHRPRRLYNHVLFGAKGDVPAHWAAHLGEIWSHISHIP